MCFFTFNFDIIFLTVLLRNFNHSLLLWKMLKVFTDLFSVVTNYTMSQNINAAFFLHHLKYINTPRVQTILWMLLRENPRKYEIIMDLCSTTKSVCQSREVMSLYFSWENSKYVSRKQIVQQWASLNKEKH